jgi:hypothetical protein
VPVRQSAGERRQEREGVKSVVDLLERRRRGGGIKGLDDKSSGGYVRGHGYQVIWVKLH